MPLHHRRRRVGLLVPCLAAAALVVACSPGARASRTPGGPPPPLHRTALVGATDPATLYREAGLFVQGDPLPFVGTVRVLAGAAPDSALALVTLSLANAVLTFTGTDGVHRATYTVTLEFERDGVPVRRVESRETVQVGSYRETTRTDESVIFQRFVAIPAGEYALGVVVRDEGSPRAGAQQARVTVPLYGTARLAEPVAVYRAVPRTRADSLPALVANPRGTVIFGRDSLAPVYLEGYHLAPDQRVAVTVANADGEAVLHDTVSLARHGALSASVLNFPVSSIGVGRLTVLASLVGSSDTVRVPLFVSFGEELGITTFDELMGYLRYFATPERLRALRDTMPEDRAAAWAAFWGATDPNPSTAEHEALRGYFTRVAAANQRFDEEGTPGWLTDRGKVFITLGEPDQLLQQGPGSNTRGRAQIWMYGQHGMQLVFVDQTGFGRWRLTPESETEFQQVAQRERVH